MEYSIKTTNTELDFLEAVKAKNVPLLVLDQKWHHIFTGVQKPEEVVQYEKRVNELLLQQSRMQQEVKALKKIKSDLMKNIVDNMEGAEAEEGHVQSKKLAEDRRLIDEVNEKIELCEDVLLDMPKNLKEANDLLMHETMKYCYGKLRVNAADVEEIGEWIRNIRIELKKQIIRKQNAEIKNKEIYSYMHDIFGAQVIDMFDLQYEADEIGEGQEKKTE